jgi:hypothetical protein
MPDAKSAIPAPPMSGGSGCSEWRVSYRGDKKFRKKIAACITGTAQRRE